MKEWAMVGLLAVVAVLSILMVREFSFQSRWKRCLRQARDIVQASKLQYPGCEGAICGITLEPAIKPAAATQNITLEDFLDQLDRVEPAHTPLTSFCSNEVELMATESDWNVDSYPTPKGALGRSDGQSVTASSARDWTANMRKMGNIMQAFDEQFGTGWIASRVPKIAGVKDIAGYEKASAAVMLKRSMEVAFSSMDQPAVIDQGSGLGAIMAGYKKLTDFANRYTAASAYAAGKPTDLYYAPTAACITGTLTAFSSRANWKAIAKALRVAAQMKTDWMLIAGLTLRQAVTDLTEPQTVTFASGFTGTAAIVGGAATQVKVLSRAEQESTLGTSIDVIQTDFGRIMVTDTDYIGTTTTDVSGNALSAWSTTSGTGAGARGNAAFVSNAECGLILKKGNVFKRWGVAPFTVQLGQDGSGDVFDSKCASMLGVRNPTLAGWLNLSS